MPKKWTPEEKKAFGAKMKAARAAKKPVTQPVEAVVEDKVAQMSAGDSNIAAIVAAVLKEVQNQPAPAVQDSGNLVRLYSVDKADYDDPTDRLYDLPELERFAMRQNFLLEWDVEMVKYDKVDGIWYQEPCFTVTLFRYPSDDELAESEERGGDLTRHSRIQENKHMQGEDVVAAQKAADKLGMKVGVDFEDFDQLMNEMRFERIKKWLVDYLIRPRVQPDRPNAPRELVIGGMVKKVHNLGGGEVMVESERNL